MEWKFKCLEKSDTLVNNRNEQLFKDGELSKIVTMALVREDIQNRLDATSSKSGGPVIVRYFLSDTDYAVPASQAEKWFSSLYPHLKAAQKNCKELSNQNVPYMTLECFNTKGLKGNPADIPNEETEQSENRNDFFWFIRNVGRSGKKGNERGRWGLGKIVYSALSDARAFFCYSVREDHPPVLIGRASLDVHHIGEQRQSGEGYFGQFRDETDPSFAMPLTSDEVLQEFRTVFNLSRQPWEPGTSLVIPFYHTEVTEQALIQSVIESYFWEILQKNLIVEVATKPNVYTTIATDTLEDVINEKIREQESRDNLLRKIRFCRTVITSRNSPSAEKSTFRIAPRQSYTEPEFEALLAEEKFALARQKYEAEELICFDLEVNFQKEKQQFNGIFSVYLQKDSELDSPDETFIRNGLTIINERYIKDIKLHALTVIEQKSPELNCFLGDAENPAHTRWDPTLETFKGQYGHGSRAVLLYIQTAGKKLVRSLTTDDEDAFVDLLNEFFGIPDNGTGKSLSKSKRVGEQPTPPKRPDKQIPTSQSPIVIVPITGTQKGIKVKGSPHFDAKMVKSVRIKIAYDLEGSTNPFSDYHPIDFNFLEKGISIQSIGCKEDRSLRAPNTLVFENLASVFQVNLTGFDPNRDLVVNITTKKATDDLEDEE